MSFEGNFLREDLVLIISNRLKRQELKEYIKFVKKEIKRNSVIITSAFAMNLKDKNELETIFTDKTISYKLDPALILGIRIEADDIEYNLNLKTRIEEIARYTAK